MKAGRGTYVNKLRLHEIRNARKQFILRLDDATELTVSFGARVALAKGPGLKQLGFEEPRPELWQIGKKTPRVVLMAEKDELERGVRAIAERHGVSTIILGGLPSLLSTEFFVRALRPAIRGPIVLMAYVDFDPGGWIATTGFIQQLARYGVKVSRVGHLVLPSRFTPEEIALHSYPLPATTPQIGGKIEEWVGGTGGIHGQARGMHADLLPVARVLAAWDEEMAPPGR